MIQLKSKIDSQDNLSRKYVWGVSKTHLIESGYIQFPEREYDSLCISSQIGCGLGCSFCATSLNGMVRNLNADEIIGQVEGMIKDTDYPHRKMEVSFTGMGEALLNFNSVVSAIQNLSTSYQDLHFTLSTTGIVPKIYELAEYNFNLQLRISLHAPNDELRTQLMPINIKYPLHTILSAAKYYAEKSEKKVILNYLMIDSVNDSEKHAHQLVKLLKGLPIRLRISKLSPVPETGLKASTDIKHQSFTKICTQEGLDTYQFNSLGTDIEVGMGQLRPDVLMSLEDFSSLYLQKTTKCLLIAN